jgi:hypothetical protein
VVRERGCTTCHLWLTIENQFLSNREQRTFPLDANFRTFVQGDLSINEYYRKFKAMADGLANLGTPVEDWILVLNILWGLNQCFEHVGSIIWRYSPFLNILKVRDDLLLEEIHMDSIGPSAAPTALYTNVTSPTAKPPSSTPSRPSNGGNSGTGGNQTKYNNKNPRMEPLAQRKLGPAVAGQLLRHHSAPLAPFLGLGLGGGLRRDAPHHSIS